MPASDDSQTISSKNWFNVHAPAPFQNNRRLGIRFIRDDITVAINKNALFGFSPKNTEIGVTLIDISSKGILIATNEKLQVNKNIRLTIRFVDMREFRINGKIVRKTGADQFFYGVKFDRVDNRLADYLIITQKKLTFK